MLERGLIYSFLLPHIWFTCYLLMGFLSLYLVGYYDLHDDDGVGL
jgi:hypothetical protein